MFRARADEQLLAELKSESAAGAAISSHAFSDVEQHVMRTMTAHTYEAGHIGAGLPGEGEAPI